VVQGERERASDNKSLGRFDLDGIPPAPRGQPQIEVSFNIDANGILNVSAKDKTTGKAQSIVIKASSGLSEEEIQRMVQDAEAHKEEDRKFHELVGARNKADALIHQVTKLLEDGKDKISDTEKAEVETAIQELKTSMQKEDKAEIEAKTQGLETKMQKLAEKVGSSGTQDQAQTAETQPQSESAQGKGQQEEVVDAEFEEIKDKDKN